VNSNQINAFAIPGGYIGLNAGLILLTENEAQLASVVAHEISHIKLRHTAEMIANSSRNSIPTWIGIFAGIFSGNPQASIAALQTGLGITMQKNINLIRSNEVEADTLGLKILENSNFDNTQMSKLFELMQSATGDVQKNLAYLSTHPMFEERIANTKNRSSSLSDTMTNSSMDYFFIKNILLANQEIDISGEIKSSSNSTLISRHKLALLYQKKSSFKKSLEILKNDVKNKSNIYITIAYVDSLIGAGKIDDAIDLITNTMNLNPLNRILPIKLAEIYADYKNGSENAIGLMENNKKYYKHNPDFHRLLSKLYAQENNIYKSSVHLSDYYVLLNNTRLAIDVLENASKSDEITQNQRQRVLDKKQDILCTYRKPLEPIFGEKTCN
tara:strand:- start:361 stop:1518 length:1158 start_codon:yes stop_codon:yes gene_type:complete